MFCEHCGKEIKDEAKFCKYCGSQVLPAAADTEKKTESYAEKTVDIEKKTEPCAEGIADAKSNRKKWIVALTSLFGIAVVVGAGMLAFSLKETAPVATPNENVEKQVENGEVEKTLEATDATEAEEEAPYELLVCVPVEYMSLRENPGLGEDVIAELLPGTYVKWYGETSVVEEKEYYKVKVRDTGEEGYLSAGFCAAVEFEPDMSQLTVVETDTALYTYEMMIEDIHTLSSQYTDRLQDRIIGYSVDGRELHEIILGNPNAQNHIMMQAGIHGREYMTSQLIMKMIEYYAYYYDEAVFEYTSYRDIFDKTALHIVPMTNPDGITISQLGVNALHDSSLADLVYECYERDRGTLVCEEDSIGYPNWVDYYKDSNFQRPADAEMITFEEYQTIWKANGEGVDLNNNFDAGWEGIQLKEYPAYGSFKGYYPVSEPESVALVELAYEHDYQCFISYHSRGQLIYYDVNGNTEENSQASLNFANLLKNWIKYEPVNTNKAYNVNLGGFGDWIQLALNKPSVTIESGKMPCPLAIDEFSSMWYRHRESWAMLGMQFY